MRKILVLAIAPLLLTACAANRPITPKACPARSLAVVHLPTTVRDASLRRVEHDDKDKISAEILMQDRQRLDTAAPPVMQAALEQAGLQSVAVPPALQKPGEMGQPVEPATLSTLQAAQPADVYMRWQITDYGETPVRWRNAYIAFEVVSTVAIAGAFYVHAVTRPVAGIYLVEEGAEEIGEGYAGFWILNRLSRPVRIEADLIDGRTGAVLWHKADTGLSGWKWHDVWRMDDAELNALLNHSMSKAATNVATGSAAYLAAHCE